MSKKEYVKQFISLFLSSYSQKHYAVADADHLIRQDDHIIESSTEHFIVVNGKDIDVVVRLFYMTPDNAKGVFSVIHISNWNTLRG